MMSQSWMGSDFSNKDISKSTDIIDQYDHKLLETREQDGHKIYVIESIPHEDAAVVWGKEVLSVRDDYVLLEQQSVDTRGLESQMRGNAVDGLEAIFANWWTAFGSIAYMEGENKVTNEPLASIPPLKIILGVRYQRPAWWTEANLRFLDRNDRGYDLHRLEPGDRCQRHRT